MDNVIAALLWPFRKALAWAGAAVVILGGVWMASARNTKQAQEIDHLENEVEAHERLNKADTGAGISDDERIARLSKFAAKHRD